MSIIILKNILSELVNSDGTRIGGNNVKLSRDNSKSASNSTMDPMYDPEDGDQVRNSVVQSTRQQGYRGYYSLVPMPAVRTPTASVYNYMDNIDYMDDDVSPKVGDTYQNVKVKTQKGSEKRTVKIISVYPKKEEVLVRTDAGGEAIVSFNELFKGNLKNDRMTESSKKKMKSMVEDIVDKKFPKEVVDKIKKYGDIRKNGVPDIEIISDENPLLVRKVKSLMDIIEKNQATGEQKGVILNFLINNIGTVDIPTEYKQEMLKKLR